MAGGISALNKALQKLLERTEVLGGATTANEAITNLGLAQSKITYSGYYDGNMYKEVYENGLIKIFGRMSVLLTPKGTAWKNGAYIHEAWLKGSLPKELKTIMFANIQSASGVVFSMLGIAEIDTNQSPPKPYFYVENGDVEGGDDLLGYVEIIGLTR